MTDTTHDKQPSWHQRLVRRLFSSTQRDLRFAIYAARMANEEEKIGKIRLLLDTIGNEALEKHKRLCCEAVPMDDARRELQVSPDVINLAHKLGYDRIYGLRLHA